MTEQEYIRISDRIRLEVIKNLVMQLNDDELIDKLSPIVHEVWEARR